MDAAGFADIPGVSDVVIEGEALTCRIDGPAHELIQAIARHRVVTITAEEPDIEELFFERFESSRGNDAK